jgi:hypothetical protein
MAARCPARHGVGMPLFTSQYTDVAASAHQLQRAAGHFQRTASSEDTVANLPVALAHIEEALDRLATGVTMAAQAVEEPDASPEARALQWHLFHLASRLRGAQETCVGPRRWARTFLLEH